jgi:glycosyltransferase involved in cell wall biosynthesis
LSEQKSTTVLFLRTDACTVEPRIQKEAGSLRKHHYRVLAFGWDRKGEYPESEELVGVTYRRSRIPAPYGSKMLAFLLPLFWLRAAFELLRVRPDVVHACDLDALIPALAVRPLLGFQIVYDIFDIFSEKITNLPPAVRKLLNRIDRKLMRQARAVVVTDEKRRGLIADIPLRRVEVLLNVPPLSTPDPPRRDRHLFRICYAGNIHEHRGLRVIADALRGVEGIEVLFAGWITRKEDESFLRQQSHITALYDPALPINALASSNKIFEAMSVRKPIITNRETTMAPLVEQEQCGVLVPYGDVGALRDAVVRMRDDPASRERMGSNGYSAFLSRYNWAIMEERLIRLYGEIVPSRRG